MIQLILDGDEFLVKQHVGAIKAGMGDAEMASLNTAELVGNQADAARILGDASMMPFLAAKRLMLVYGYLDHLDKRMAASKSADSAAHAEAVQLLDGLTHPPETADIIFIDSVDKRRQLWKGFTRPASADAPERKIGGLSELVQAKHAALVELGAPDARALPGWIQQYAKRHNIAIEGQAIRMLCDYVGVNLRQLENELQKLAAYASGRAISGQDVKLLVSDASEALIWNLTDALSQRNGRTAMRSLYELRRGDANPFYLLTMITRQYRIMVKVKDAASSGGGNEYDIAKLVGESPYPVKKALQQSRQYKIEELDAIMERLLETDYAMKTGADPETAIDVLVAELTQRNR
ncbi:MAG: DNA polymerase III subunit delta [Caldilineaceae bacterium]|nr:DNA polymerase III subunit delta [Caldilineaceae bacterium]